LGGQNQLALSPGILADFYDSWKTNQQQETNDQQFILLLLVKQIFKLVLNVGPFVPETDFKFVPPGWRFLLWQDIIIQMHVGRFNIWNEPR
jgi:hypothetical protein